MIKRFISVLVAFGIVFSSVGALAAENATIYVNEVFDDYALNSVPKNVNVNGVDARVVSRNGSDKAIYSKMWGSGASVKIPVSGSGDKMVFSFDLMLKGENYSGTVLSLNTTSSLLKINQGGRVTLEDGYEVGGQPSGIWHTYTAAIDYTNRIYDLYIDGKKKISKRYFNTKPSAPSDLVFAFGLTNEDSVAELYVDNVRIYSGNNVLSEKAFPKKAASSEIVEFTPVAEKPTEDIVYIDSYGRSGLSGGAVKFIQKDNSFVGWGKLNEKEPECIHYNQLSTYDSWAEVTTGVTEDVSSFVFQADIYIVSLSSGSATLARSYDSSRYYSTLLEVRSNGSLVVFNNETVGTIPFGTWVNYAIAIDYISGVADVYINGKLVKDNAGPLNNGAITPTMIELKMNTAPSEGHNEMYINNIKAYGGTKLREFNTPAPDEITEVVPDDSYRSMQESDEDAKKRLGTDVVFMTGCDYYFADGKKSNYSDIGKAAYKDAKLGVMVPVSLAASTLDTEIEIKDGKVYADGNATNVATATKEGTDFVAVDALAGDVLSKYVYNDPRGMLLISNTDRGYSNDINSMNTLEASDFIYRYMQFERPSGDEIYEAVKKNSYQMHPRMFVRADEIPALRERIQNNEMMKNELSSLLSKCENYMDMDPVKYEIPDGLRLFSSCYAVKTRLMDLGTAYLITGDNKYRKRMWTEVQNALSWKDWNLENHFLDSGEIGPGIAFAYDILYDYLTEEERQYYRDRVEELFLNFAVGVYTGESSFSCSDGRLTRTNWGAVCANSMLMCALTFIDDEGEDSEFTQKCKFVAECSIQQHEYPFEVPFPDGDISEGIGYWSYFVESLGWSVKTLLNMCGSDYGMLDSPGYPIMADFELYVQTPEGVYAHCDTYYKDANLPIVPETYLIAQFYDKPDLMQTLDDFRQIMGKGLEARGLLWYIPPEDNYVPDAYSLDKHFSQSLTVMRSDWGSDANYVGVSCGIIHSESHLDKGSFQFETYGERWFVDLGKDEYNIPGYFDDAGYLLYRKRAEGHNCLVINPSATEPDQIPYSNPTTVRYETKPRGGIVVCDLTDSYANDVKSYKRGFYFGDDRNTLVVQDEVELLKPNSEFYHFLHTEGDITILPDGKTAVVEKNGKKLRLEVYCDAPNWKLEARDTTPLFPQNSNDAEYSRDAFKKLAIVGKATGKLNISVKMIPEDGRAYPSYTFVPMSEWTIPDGEIVETATLDYIMVNGKVIDGFKSSNTSYNVALNYGESTYVYASSSNGTVEIQQAQSATDAAIITVTDNDGYKREYKVQFSVITTVTDRAIYGSTVAGLPDNAKLCSAKSVVASHIPQPENSPDHVIDGNFSTRWSADTSGAYIEIDLGEVKDLSGVAVAFMDGSKRNSTYEILVSENNFNYDRIFSGKSTGETEEYEYLLAPVRARYIRLAGYGNTENEWNSVTELAAFTLE